MFRFFLLCLISLSLEALPSKGIAFVFDGQMEQDNRFFTAMRDETKELIDEEFNAEYLKFSGNWTYRGAQAAVLRALDDPRVDVVVTAGVISSQAAASLDVSKPVVLPIVLDKGLTRLKTANNSFFSYVDETKNIRADFETFHTLAPYKSVAIISDPALLDDPDFPEVRLAIEEIAKEMAFTPLFINALENPEEALERLKPDAAFIFPLWRLPPTKLTDLIEKINAQKLPSFSIVGEWHVDHGVLATTTPHSFAKKLARRVALNVQSILIEGDTSETESSFNVRHELIINLATLKDLGIYPPWDLLSTARFLQRPEQQEKKVTLTGATKAALSANLELSREEWVIEEGRQRVRGRKSELLPQLSISAMASQIDSDRARGAAGSAPERAMNARLRLAQLIYDDTLYGLYHAEKSNQKARESDQKALELDIIQKASTAYLNVLKLKAIEKVERENLTVTQANLKRARDRVTSGEARRSEEYRWESEVARNKQKLLQAFANRRNGETTLNKILNRPIDEAAELADVSHKSDEFTFINTIIDSHIKNPLAFDRLTNVAVKCALSASPELMAIDFILGAQDRLFTASKRSYYIPSVALEAEAKNTFAKGGAGKTRPPGSGVDDIDASAAITLSLPLITGHKRHAEKEKVRAIIRQIEDERKELAQLIEQRVLDALDQLKSSYAGIRLSKMASESAKQNLTIVRNAYARGVISIVDLIDAQNTSFVADQNRDTAVYDYLINMIELERAMATYPHLKSNEENAAMLHQIDTHLKRQP